MEEKTIQKTRTTVHRLVGFAAAGVAAAVAAAAVVAPVTEAQEEPVGRGSLESGLSVVACPEDAVQEGKSEQPAALDGEVVARSAVGQVRVATRRPSLGGRSGHSEDPKVRL